MLICGQTILLQINARVPICGVVDLTEWCLGLRREVLKHLRLRYILNAHVVRSDNRGNFIIFIIN